MHRKWTILMTLVAVVALSLTSDSASAGHRKRRRCCGNSCSGGYHGGGYGAYKNAGHNYAGQNYAGQNYAGQNYAAPTTSDGYVTGQYDPNREGDAQADFRNGARNYGQVPLNQPGIDGSGRTGVQPNQSVPGVTGRTGVSGSADVNADGGAIRGRANVDSNTEGNILPEAPKATTTNP